MNRYERRKLAIEDEIRKHIGEYKAIYKKAEDEDREPTTEERLEIESHLSAMDVLDEEKKGVEENIKTLERVDETGRKLGAVSPLNLDRSDDTRVVSEGYDRWHQQVVVKTLGEQFTSAKGFRDAVAGYREGGRVNTGAIALDMKGTLLEGPGGGGAALGNVVPQVMPGVVDKLFQRVTIANLLDEIPVSVPSFRYVVEGTATSGAAGTPEGGTKPQSTLGLTTTDEPIKKIATAIKISDEMIEDAPAVQAYINGRLRLFVLIEEERELLRGASGGNEVQGLLTSRNVPVYAGGTAVGNRAIQLFKAMNGMRGSAFVEPEWVVIHPTDYEVIRLLQDNSGQFYGGGPFYGPYGGPQGPADASHQLDNINDYVWQKPTIVTAAVGAGTALVGSRMGAAVLRRGGLTVEATNSNEADFLNNLIALRCEERLGLAVFRPNAFVEVRLA